MPGRLRRPPALVASVHELSGFEQGVGVIEKVAVKHDEIAPGSAAPMGATRSEQRRFLNTTGRPAARWNAATEARSRRSCSGVVSSRATYWGYRRKNRYQNGPHSLGANRSSVRPNRDSKVRGALRPRARRSARAGQPNIEQCRFERYETSKHATMSWYRSVEPHLGAPSSSTGGDPGPASERQSACSMASSAEFAPCRNGFQRSP